MSENAEIVKYLHQGAEVSVRQGDAGLDKLHCLCPLCDSFHPGESNNCPIAHRLHRICVENDVTTPVWECRRFVMIKNACIHGNVEGECKICESLLPTPDTLGATNG